MLLGGDLKEIETKYQAINQNRNAAGRVIMVKTNYLLGLHSNRCFTEFANKEPLFPMRWFYYVSPSQ
jgi:hypothetical protein